MKNLTATITEELGNHIDVLSRVISILSKAKEDIEDINTPFDAPVLDEFVTVEPKLKKVPTPRPIVSVAAIVKSFLNISLRTGNPFTKKELEAYVAKVIKEPSSKAITSAIYQYHKQHHTKFEYREIDNNKVIVLASIEQ